MVEVQEFENDFINGSDRIKLVQTLLNKHGVILQYNEGATAILPYNMKEKYYKWLKEQKIIGGKDSVISIPDKQLSFDLEIKTCSCNGTYGIIKDDEYPNISDDTIFSLFKVDENEENEYKAIIKIVFCLKKNLIKKSSVYNSDRSSRPASNYSFEKGSIIYINKEEKAIKGLDYMGNKSTLISDRIIRFVDKTKQGGIFDF